MHARCFAVMAFGLLLAGTSAADQVGVDAGSAARYVESCRKPNGAFGPRDQEYTDAAWNYPAVRTLVILGHEIKDKQAILEHGLGFPEGTAATVIGCSFTGKGSAVRLARRPIGKTES